MPPDFFQQGLAPVTFFPEHSSDFRLVKPSICQINDIPKQVTTKFD